MPAPTGFSDHFSRDAAGYARFRPRYPAALFSWLATLPAARLLALDCATGNGQAATQLSAHFSRVLGMDASRAQLRAASRGSGVQYFAGLAEALPLAPDRVDLITVAQALHWLDLSRFLAEVERVGAPGAALAVWGYGRLRAAPAIDAVIDRFHDETVGACWSPARRLVEEAYSGVELPITPARVPPFVITAALTLPELLGYLRTWSAVGKYLAVHGQDPVEGVEPELAACWGESGSRREVVWPLFVRAGRLQSSRTKVTLRSTR